MAIPQQLGLTRRSPSVTEAQPNALHCEGDTLYKKHFQPEESETHLQEALNAYTRALEQTPDSADIYCGMAKTFLLLGQYAKADQCATKATQLAHTKDLPRPHLQKILYDTACIQGAIAQAHGDIEKACQAYQSALPQGGLRSTRARFGLFETLRQHLWTQPKNQLFRFKTLQAGLKALYALCSSVLLIPFDPERFSLIQWATFAPNCLLAWIQEESGQHEAALKRYLDIHNQYPGLAGIGMVIGELYAEKGEFDLARYWFTKALERHPADLDAYHHLARLCEREEDYTAMAALYEKMVCLKPSDPHLWCNLANASYYSHQYKEALTYYETAFHLGNDPHWKALVAQSLGNIQADYLQNPEAAIAYYDMAKTLDPSDLENYIQLGLQYFQKEDYVNAEVVYLQATRITPKNPRLYSNLGYLRWQADDLPGAITFYEKALSLDSSYEIPLNNLGVIYLDSCGEIQKAISYFERAIEADNHYALAYYNLGRAYGLIGNRPEAASCFQQAQALNLASQELDPDELTARIHQLFDSCELGHPD